MVEEAEQVLLGVILLAITQGAQGVLESLQQYQVLTRITQVAAVAGQTMLRRITALSAVWAAVAMALVLETKHLVQELLILAVAAAVDQTVVPATTGVPVVQGSLSLPTLEHNAAQAAPSLA